MALDKIIERIIKDAEAKAEEIIKEAEDKAKELQKTKSDEAKNEAALIIQKAKRQAKDEQSQIIANVKLEARKIILQEKREIVEKAFTNAKKKLRELSQNIYIDLMVKLIEENALGGEQLILSPKEKETLGKKLVDYSQMAFANRNKDISVSLSKETRDIEKGFILSKEGIELNFSLNNLIETARGEFEPVVIKELF